MVIWQPPLPINCPRGLWMTPKLYENEKQRMIWIEIMHAPQNVADQLLINHIQFILVFWYEQLAKSNVCL